MNAEPDAHNERLQKALIALMHTRSDHRKVWDKEPLKGWAVDLLSAREDAPGDAWVIVRQQLGDPVLDDPLLLAAGWLLKLRGNTPEDVQRDTHRPVGEVLPDLKHRLTPAKTVTARNLIAVACLERDVDAARIVFERDAKRASVFQTGRAETRGEKLVAERLRKAAEDWFEEDGRPTANRGLAVRGNPGERIVTQTGDEHQKHQSGEGNDQLEIPADQTYAAEGVPTSVLKSRRLLVLMGTIGVLAALVATSALVGPRIFDSGAHVPNAGSNAKPSYAATQLRTFSPGSDYADLASKPGADDFQMTCWKRSYVSARKDARLCALGSAGIVSDPCFYVDKEHVVCPLSREMYSGKKDPGLIGKVVEQIEPPGNVSGQIVGIEDAIRTRYPWAFELDYADPSGANYVCTPLISSKDLFASVTFWCGAEMKGAFFTIFANDLSQGKWLTITGAGVTYAGSLDKTHPIWTVTIVDKQGNELRKANVISAWF